MDVCLVSVVSSIIDSKPSGENKVSARPKISGLEKCFGDLTITPTLVR